MIQIKLFKGNINDIEKESNKRLAEMSKKHAVVQWLDTQIAINQHGTVIVLTVNIPVKYE